MSQIRVISVSGSKPTVTQLALGDIALNTYDGKAYIKKVVGVSGSVIELGGSGTTISASYALSASYATLATTASYFSGSISNAISASYAATASYATNFTVSGSITQVDYIDFDTGSTVTQPYAGRLSWNQTDKTLDLGTGDGNTTLQVGQETVYPPVVNKDSVDLGEGTLVMVDPTQIAQGNRIRVVRAVTDGTYPSQYIVGILTEDIAKNQEGYATWFGYVRNLNIPTLESSSIKPSGESWAEGNVLFGNPAVPGGLTYTQPEAPAVDATIAVITSINGNNLTLLVRPTLTVNVGELNNVKDTTTSGSYGDLFIKSGSLWITGRQLTGSYGLTGSLTATSLTASNALISGNVVINGTASINSLIINQISYSSGSNQLGDAVNDTQTLYGTVNIPTGSLNVSGSTTITGSLIVTRGITGSFSGSGLISSASYAATSSFPWFPTGSNIAYVGGNVGVGTSTPSDTFTVNGIVSATNESFATKKGAIIGNGSNPTFVQILSRTAGGYAYSLFKGFAANTTTGLSSSILDYGAYGDLQSGITAPTITYGYFCVGTGSAYNNTHLRIYDNANKLITIDGNLNIGSTSNSGYRLFVKGSGATSATTALRVEDSNSTPSLVVLDNGFVGIRRSNPTVALDVSGSAIISGSVSIVNSGGIYLYDSNGYGGGRVYGSYGYALGEVYIRPVGTVDGAFVFSPTNGLSIGGFTIGGTTGSPPAYGLAVSGSIGIGTRLPITQLDVSGSGRFTGNLTVTGSIIAASFTGSLLGTSSNALTASYVNPLAQTVTLTGSLIITGSAGTGSAVTVYKSGSTVLDIQGSSGQLFAVTDSLTGSLFSVNTAAGLPVIEAFSDNTVNIGKFGIYPIKVAATGTLAVITGSFTGSLSGSLFGTSSWSVSSSAAITSSYAISSSYAATASYVNPLVQPVTITGSTTVKGDFTVTSATTVDLNASTLNINAVTLQVPSFSTPYSPSATVRVVMYDAISNVLFVTASTAPSPVIVNTIATGSITASVQIGPAATVPYFFLVQSGSVEMLKINAERVMVLEARTTAPTAVTGGIYYSASGDFYFGM